MLCKRKLQVKFKKLHSDAKTPTKHLDAACFDLYSIQDCFIRPSTAVTVHTGIALEIPIGFAGFIHTRSGMGINHGLRVHLGVIDPDFRGEVSVHIFSHSSNIGTYELLEGDRVAQIFFAPILPVELIEAVELSETVRGENCHGSSGR